MVAYAEGEIGEYHSSSPAADLEHHAELADRRWKIDLDTSVQPRSVLRFAVACEKIRDGATVSFVDATRLDCDGTSGIGGASQILAERQRVEDDRGATRLCSGHLLTVAVGWPDGPVLLFEFRDRGRRQVVAPADRGAAGVGYQQQRSVGTLLFDEVLTGTVAA
jgi:hypothetical protein